MQKFKRIRVRAEEAGTRLDKVITGRLKGYTRQYLQRLIDEDVVKINGKKAKAGQKVKDTDIIEILIPAAKSLGLKPKEMNLDIVYEDKDLIVVNKREGVVVHPGQGGSHEEDSLVNGLLAHCGQSLSGIGGVMRPGIVHRLDKDTSGLIVVAKNDRTHQYLSGLFKERKIKKTYYALVSGVLSPDKGMIDSPIGRSHGDRKKMAVTSEDKGRNAITKYSVVNHFKNSTYVVVNLVTGRTHQIRVHFAAIGYPLVGDKIYGKISVNNNFEHDYGLNRLFLHAGTLEFILPGKKRSKVFKSSLPQELERTIKLLKREKED